MLDKTNKLIHVSHFIDINLRSILAEYLKTERLMQRLDHAQVCEQAGISQSTLTRVENSHGNVTFDNIQALLGVYKLDTDLIIFLNKEIEYSKRILAKRT